jgi:asparagine synthase (glutamine-hydrolysing)
VLICNGEIYNYKELYKLMNVSPNTDSDCEVIIHLYLKYGIEQTLVMLDGVFAFILFDNRVKKSDLNSKVYVARDPYGVRPLYVLKYKTYETYNPNVIGFASELKCLSNIYNKLIIPRPHLPANFINYTLKQFTPGTYSVFNYGSMVNSIWEPYQENIKYIIPAFPTFLTHYEVYNYHNLIYKYLYQAVKKRCCTTERPIACLLSGGLDSSLIAALVVNYYIKAGKNIDTYSIGLVGSEDLKYARIVADYLKTNHHEIIVTEENIFQAIPEVIKAIESYDTTTVRASIGNYLLGKYISTHSENKVIFNGDGSDELFGGYLYMNKCPDSIEFDKETRRLLKDIYLFDVLRSDKCISSHGLEPRTPFLDKTLVNYVMSIPVDIKNHNIDRNCEKYLLRMSIMRCAPDLLPKEILWRKKEAFSDGVTSKSRSLFKILQEYIAKECNTLEPCIETEKYYYKNLFDTYYPNCSHVLPYYWMPKYVENITDPSARTLGDIYQNEIETNSNPSDSSGIS